VSQIYDKLTEEWDTTDGAFAFFDEWTAFSGEQGRQEMIKLSGELKPYPDGVADGAGGLMLIMHRIRTGIDCELWLQIG
jgi:hypothetical protein